MGCATRTTLYDADLGFELDLGGLVAGQGALVAGLAALEPELEAAIEQMARLEAGALANPDEGRMVGHYWLRAPELAPSAATPNQDGTQAILAARRASEALASRLAETHDRAVVVGIGGSALGPQLLYEALRRPGQTRPLHFCDNTDPDGIDLLLAELGEDLSRTLCVVISKSGGTKETRNGMLEMARAYERRGLSLGEHAVAITQEGSKLDQLALTDAWLGRLPMWDWVGGRTSVTSAVGLFPAAFSGLDAGALLDGAAAMDRLGRRGVQHNPAAMLAAAWRLAGPGRAMVMLPYKDRLALVSRYLQQLVMESLGKRFDRAGREIHAGLTVYGNKGSTDQHAYVQQLLDGPDDFFVTFIQVLAARPAGEPLEVEPGITTGDYLFGFLQGTRRALADRGRRSLLLAFEQLDARALGALIALYERAVGIYAALLDVNAYHQPAVESGKQAAAAFLELQRAVEGALEATPADAATIAKRVQGSDADVLAVLRHLAANGRASVDRDHGAQPCDWRFARRGA